MLFYGAEFKILIFVCLDALLVYVSLLMLQFYPVSCFGNLFG